MNIQDSDLRSSVEAFYATAMSNRFGVPDNEPVLTQLRLLCSRRQRIRATVAEAHAENENLIPTRQTLAFGFDDNGEVVAVNMRGEWCHQGRKYGNIEELEVELARPGRPYFFREVDSETVARETVVVAWCDYAFLCLRVERGKVSMSSDELRRLAPASIKTRTIDSMLRDARTAARAEVARDSLRAQPANTNLSPTY